MGTNPVSRDEVEDLYSHYAEVLCDFRLLEWPEFFLDKCLYKVTPRTNHDRGLPLGPMFAESKGALIDRVRAIQGALVYAPRHITYVVGTVRLVEAGPEEAVSRSMFSAFQTLNGDTEVLMVGRTFDVLRRDEGRLKFKERIVVFDTERVPGALVYPV